MRPTLRLSSPAWLAAPRITSSIAAGVDAVALDEGADHMGRHVVGAHAGERAAVAAERRPQPVDHDRRAGWVAGRGPAHRAAAIRGGGAPDAWR